MRSFLVDANVWLALCSDRHVHHAAAHRWFPTVPPGGAFLCRLTQLALLRLLTNARVMGVDVLTQAGAWSVYDRLRQDARVGYTDEPLGLEAAFRHLTQTRQPAAGAWTDAYLAALAETRGLTVVSFDRGFRRLGGIDALILPLA